VLNFKIGQLLACPYSLFYLRDLQWKLTSKDLCPVLQGKWVMQDALLTGSALFEFLCSQYKKVKELDYYCRDDNNGRGP